MPDVFLIIIGTITTVVGFIATIVSCGERKFYPLSLIIIVPFLVFGWLIHAASNRQIVDIGTYQVKVVDDVPIIVINNNVYNLTRTFEKNIAAGTQIKVTILESSRNGIFFCKSNYKFKIVSPEQTDVQ